MKIFRNHRFDVRRWKNDAKFLLGVDESATILEIVRIVINLVVEKIFVLKKRKNSCRSEKEILSDEPVPFRPAFLQWSSSFCSFLRSSSFCSNIELKCRRLKYSPVLFADFLVRYPSNFFRAVDCCCFRRIDVLSSKSDSLNVVHSVEPISECFVRLEKDVTLVRRTNSDRSSNRTAENEPNDCRSAILKLLDSEHVLRYRCSKNFRQSENS